MCYRFIVSLLIIFSCAFGDALGKSAEPAEDHAEQNRTGQERVDDMLQRFDEHAGTGSREEIEAELREILSISLRDGYEHGYLEGLLRFGDYYLDREMPELAMIPIGEGLSENRASRYRLRFLNQLGTAVRMDGDSPEAIRHYSQALALADSLSADRESTRILLNIAITQKMLGDVSSAFENLYRSLLKAEQVGEPVLMAVVLNHIGELYLDLDNSEEGIYYFTEAERISRDNNLTDILIQSLRNLGQLNMHAGDLDVAQRFLEESGELAALTGNHTLMIPVEYSLGELHLTRGSAARARSNFTRVLESSRQTGFSEGLFLGHFGMGGLNGFENRFTEALHSYQDALLIAGQVNSGEWTGQVLEAIYETHKQAGNPVAALEALENLNVHALDSRILERERRRAEYETLLETRRQEQENQILMARQSEQEARIQLQQALGIGALIILGILLGVTILLYINVRTRERLNRELKEKNIDISTKNRELDRLNSIKNKLFAVISHDLRGPLSSIKGLLYLLKEKKLSAEKLEQLAGKLDKSLQDNASTMENLLVWAKSQMSGLTVDQVAFEIRDAITAVHGQLKFQAADKQVDIRVEESAAGRVFADLNMVKLVIRNILSNAIKFCNSGDSIVLHTSQEGGMLTLHITDTGVGIKTEDQKKIFGEDHYTRKGTMNEKGSGLGLLLCRDFVEKNGGTIWLESRYGKGTTFSFKLPLAKLPDTGETMAAEQVRVV